MSILTMHHMFEVPMLPHFASAKAPKLMWSILIPVNTRGASRDKRWFLIAHFEREQKCIVLNRAPSIMIRTRIAALV